MPKPFAARDHYQIERADAVALETPALLAEFPPKRTLLLELTPAQILALASGKLIAYEGEHETLLIGTTHE